MSALDTAIQFKHLFYNIVFLSYVRTFLRLIHFGGLIVGFGGAVFLDLLLARYRRMTLTSDLVGNVEWVSRFVAFGLLLLWVSGLGFLMLYQVSEPEKLLNPKIWAKIAIVSILTINGLAIHRYVLPFLRCQIGSEMLAGLATKYRLSLIGCGAVSAVSWSVPVVLGAVSQLNFAVPCLVILAAYGMLVVQAFLIALFLLRDKSKSTTSTT